MKKYFATYSLLFVFATSAFALTPNERKIVQHAQSTLRQAITQYNDAQAKVATADQQIAAADQRAAEAAAHAKTTDDAIGVLQKDIKAAHDREVALKAENDKMKPVYDKVRSYWGLGGVVYGIQLFAKHLFWVALGGI